MTDERGTSFPSGHTPYAYAFLVGVVDDVAVPVPVDVRGRCGGRLDSADEAEAAALVHVPLHAARYVGPRVWKEHRNKDCERFPGDVLDSGNDDSLLQK